MVLHHGSYAELYSCLTWFREQEFGSPGGAARGTAGRHRAHCRLPLRKRPPSAPPGCSCCFAANYTNLLIFLDASVVFYLGHGSIAGTSYGADEAGAQATAQSERTKPVLVANRFHAISQASMMSAKLRNTELASQWLRR